jgi:hypothetical protein
LDTFNIKADDLRPLGYKVATGRAPRGGTEQGEAELAN